jgi:hypothetical protein
LSTRVGMVPRKASASRTVGETVSMQTALNEQKIRLVSERVAVRQLWPGAPNECEVVAPGVRGRRGDIYKVKDSLKAHGFRYNPDHKLWYRPPVRQSTPDGIEAFNLGGVVAKSSVKL